MEETVREALLKTLGESIPRKQIMEFAPMSRYTTLRLGGPAEVLCEVTSAEEIRAALGDCFSAIDARPSQKLRILHRIQGEGTMKKNTSMRLVCAALVLLAMDFGNKDV